MRATECIWRRLLPDCVAISARSDVMLDANLTDAEEVSVGVVSSDRKSEFCVGRAHAREALAKLGLLGADIPIGQDAAPLWPKGVVGSITHANDGTKAYFAAAVTKAQTIGAIGIDVEFTSMVQPPTWRQFLTSRELEFVHSLPVFKRAPLVSAIWCAKEAVTKAIERRVEPRHIETRIQRSDDTIQTWRVEFVLAPGEDFVQAHTACSSGIAFAAATLGKPEINRVRHRLTRPTARA